MGYPGSQNEFGQLGCVFTDTVATAITPPTGRVFVAITFLENTVLDATNGLVPEDTEVFFGTTDAAHSLVTATGKEGTGGKQVDASNTFPRGITIYGRWTKAELDSGSIIAYVGA